MVLGDKLRGAMERLRSVAILDREAIRETVKDIQRALIAADVEVNLVFNLSKEIEKRAMKTPPKGMDRREFIIKQTYDLLVELLGGDHSLPEAPKRILLLGLFGQGKCVDGNSKITLSDGRIERIEGLFEKFSDLKVRDRDGFRIPLARSFSVPSLNPKSLKIENKEVEAIWKLKKRDRLIEVFADHGNNQSVRVTPEHPFFVLDAETVRQVRADELQAGAHIALPYSVPKVVKNDVDLTEKIRALNLNFLDEFGLKEKVKERALAEFGSLKAVHKEKNFKNPYCGFSQELKNGTFVRGEYLRAFGVKLPKQGFITVRPVQSNKPIKLPTKLTKELNLFIGFILGDGSVVKGGVEFFNEDQECIDKVVSLSNSLFGITPSVKRDKRCKKMKRVRIHSQALRAFFSGVLNFPAGNKSSTIKLNSLLLSQNNKNLAALLQAYFDCDGSVYKNERVIELVTASKNLAFQIQQALLRFNIAATHSKKNINGRFYFCLKISGISSEVFAEKIGSIIKRKQDRLRGLKRIGLGQGSGKRDMIPVGAGLKSVREQFGQTIGEIQRTVNSYGQFERNGIISRKALQKMLFCLKSKENKNWLKILRAITSGKNTYAELLKTTGYSRAFLNAILFRLQQQGFIKKVLSPNPGEHFILSGNSRALLKTNSKEKLVGQLQSLANSGVIWSKVTKTRKLKPKEWVYDLTVKDNHNFIADGIIVHNTTSAAKLAFWYKKRGRNVGLIGADVHRPASLEQLQQLGAQVEVDVYGEKGESDAAKIVSGGLAEFKKKDLVIVDSAGRSGLDTELTEEIKSVKEALSPDQVWLVLSADIGQLAKKQAMAFHEAVEVNGIILTKVDGSSKGGGALVACGETRAPVYFIGTGEKHADLEVFDAQRYLSRVMGYGDLQSLLEKAKELHETEAPEDLMSGEFTLTTFYKQLEASKKMGPLPKVMEMLGLKAQLPKEMLELGEEKLDSYKVLMDSMTKKEKSDPESINKQRIDRIARGSGKKPGEVRELLKQYKQLKKMMGKFQKLAGKGDGELSEKDIQKMMKKFSKQKKKKIRFR